MNVYTLCAQLYFEEIMAKETTVNVRIDAKTKKKAAKVFQKSGYTLSSAIQIFLTHVAEEGSIPFEYRDSRVSDLELNSAIQTGEKRYANFKELVDEIKAEIKAEAEAELVGTRSKKNAGS